MTDSGRGASRGQAAAEWARVFRNCDGKARASPLRRPRWAVPHGPQVHFEFPSEAAVEAAVRRAICSWGGSPTRLLRVLRETQEELGFLPPQALERIAGGLGVSIATTRGVAAFYSFLYTEPQGAYRVLFSDNITDRMHGSAVRLREMGERLRPTRRADEIRDDEN